MRPAWLLRLGLFVYDHLGGRRILPATRTLNLTGDPHGATLKQRYRHGFEYSDCVADDSRLVVLNALDAAERGALIRTRTRCLRADRGQEWKIVLEVRGRREVASARDICRAITTPLKKRPRCRVAWRLRKAISPFQKRSRSRWVSTSCQSNQLTPLSWQ